MNPLLSRELRARFRDDRAFLSLFLLAALLSLFFAYLYAQAIAPAAMPNGVRLSGQSIFAQLAWMQTLGWLFIAPALTTSSIAYERERGWFDSLLLSPLSPLAIVLGKWLAALLYAALLALVLLPFWLLIFLIGGVTLRQFVLIGSLQIACALCSSALGLAASAWSPRASSAQRTANSMILIGFLVSFYGAAVAGEVPFRFPPVPGSGNAFWAFLGRTNPVLRAVEISGDMAFQRIGICFTTLFVLTLFFLGVATYYARHALEEAPFVQKKRAPKRAAKGAAPQTRDTHGEIPFFSRLRFANPVLDREVRAKFRLRQPPRAVVVAETILGLLVGFFYLRTLYWAVFEPQYRNLIWWGMAFTGLIVSMMAAAIMGSNGFSREREGGTWESLRLSLLSPGEIMRGKVFASLLTCALFSLPVWPLLLPCIDWNANSNARTVIPAVVMQCLAVWLATIWSYTLIGLWMGRRAARTSRSSGQTLGLLLGFTVLAPFLFSLISRDFAIKTLGMTHPLAAFANISNRAAPEVTLKFCAFQVIFGIAVWCITQNALRAEMNRDTTKQAGG